MKIGKLETFLLVEKVPMVLWLMDTTVGFSASNRCIYNLKRKTNGGWEYVMDGV